MVKSILIVLLLLISATIQATTYQIANQTAFNAFNWSSLIAGDNVQFAKGQTFTGSITLSVSGSVGSPITLGAYGTGANPIITGFTTVSAWTNLGSNIWESTSAVSTLSGCNMVSVNGVNTAMGRFPNANATNGGYLTVDSHSVNTSITNSSLTGTPDWTGAEIVVRDGHFALGRSTISAQSTGTLNYSPALLYAPTNGYGFFIQNDPRTLDQQNEWYFNPSTNKLRIYSISQPTNVKLSTVDNLFNSSGNYITVNGIDFVGSNLNTIASSGTQFTFQNCNVSFSGRTFLDSSGANANITTNTFTTANNNGIAVSGSYSDITNNILSGIGIHHGMGGTSGGGINGALAFGAYGKTNFTVTGNTIDNVGLNGIAFYALSTVLVKNNFVSNFCTILDDGAGIYTFTGGSRPVMTGVVIDGNICVNGIGAPYGVNNTTMPAAGIYLDEQSANCEVKNNSTANTIGSGLFLNNATLINIHDNTFFGDASQQIKINSWGTVLNTITNNNLVSKSATAFCISMNSGTDDLPTKITANNNIYARPIDDNKTFMVSQPSEYGGLKYLKTLTEWQTFSSQDANSKKAPYTIASESELAFLYNETNAAKVVTAPFRGVDMAGIQYELSITLQPYTSIVLIAHDGLPVAPSGVLPYKVSGKTWNVNSKNWCL